MSRRLSGAAFVTLVLALAASASARELQQQQQQGELWALLIAGSAGWGNYRHQADVAHAYQVLRRGGLKEDRIVVMMFDDIAGNPANPHPGQMFNQPHGPDVYAGVRIDYSRDQVNAENFLAVLAGDAKGVGPRSRHNSGRVIASGPGDKVFVYYSDHGAPGVVGMPSGPFLYADQLHAVIANKSRAHGFAEMVIYIEACESGSMFQGLLEDDLGVYATTAANDHESSWGTYCPGMEPAPPVEFGTCLGDLYSVAWMENADHADLTIETLKKQFQLVKERVSRNFTYSQGSHVMRFGTANIAEEVAAEFMGYGNTGDGTVGAGKDPNAAAVPWTPLSAVPQREADLVPLYHRYATAAEGTAKAQALRELEAEVSRRAELDASVYSAVQRLLAQSDAPALLRSKFGQQLDAELARAGAQGASDGLTDLMVNGALPRPAGAALVDDWDCLRAMVAAWERSCGGLDQYGMRHTRAFANLCNAGMQPAALGASARQACGGPILAGAGKVAPGGADAQLVAAA